MLHTIDFIGVPTERRNPEPGVVELVFDPSSAYNNPKTTFFPLKDTGKITKIIIKEMKLAPTQEFGDSEEYQFILLAVFRPYPHTISLLECGVAHREDETVTLYGDDVYFITHNLHPTNFVCLGGFHSQSVDIAKRIGSVR
nr:MAG TPA: hypothetical protein [Caudoviricetes sp.]